MASKFDKRVWL